MHCFESPAECAGSHVQAVQEVLVTQQLGLQPMFADVCKGAQMAIHRAQLALQWPTTAK